MVLVHSYSSVYLYINISLQFAEDYCAEEDDPYQDPDSLAHVWALYVSFAMHFYNVLSCHPTDIVFHLQTYLIHCNYY